MEIRFIQRLKHEFNEDADFYVMKFWCLWCKSMQNIAPQKMWDEDHSVKVKILMIRFETETWLMENQVKLMIQKVLIWRYDCSYSDAWSKPVQIWLWTITLNKLLLDHKLRWQKAWSKLSVRLSNVWSCRAEMCASWVWFPGNVYTVSESIWQIHAWM